MDILISVEIASQELILADLLDECGRLKDSLTLLDEIVLAPQFATVNSRKALGASDILQFILSIPIGLGTGVAANALYNWLMKNKITKVKIENTIIVLTDDVEQMKTILKDALTRE